MDHAAFTAEIRRLMAAHATNQKRVALDAGVNETYVRDLLETDKPRDPRMFKMARVAKVLDTSLDHLVRVAGGIELRQSMDVAQDEEEAELLAIWRDLLPERRPMILAMVQAALRAATASDAA